MFLNQTDLDFMPNSKSYLDSLHVLDSYYKNISLKSFRFNSMSLSTYTTCFRSPDNRLSSDCNLANLSSLLLTILIFLGLSISELSLMDPLCSDHELILYIMIISVTYFSTLNLSSLACDFLPS